MKHMWTSVAWLLVAVYCVSARSTRRKQPDVNRETGIIDIDDDTQGSFLDPVDFRSEPASHNPGRNRARPVTQTRRKLTTVSPMRVTEHEELLAGSGDGSNENDDELDIDASGEEMSGVGPDKELTTPAPIVCRNLTSSGRKSRVFVPKCTADGKFEPVQCDNRVGQCWCVNPLSGKELTGTRHPYSSEYTCSMHDVPTTTTTIRPRPSVTAASSTKLPTTTKQMLSSHVASTSTVRLYVSSRQPSTHKQTTVARQPATSTRFTVASTTMAFPTSKSASTSVPSNKINQFPGSDDDEKQTDWTKNEVEPPLSGPKSYRINLRSTIIGQPGILAGIIGAAVVILLCLVLLIMFIIYRMHRKSQDPGIYYIDARKPMSSKKAGYMKALDHDVYT